MTRRSSRLHSRPENAPTQKGKIAKQTNKKKTQTSKKIQPVSGQSQLVLEGVVNPCILIETPDKQLGEPSEQACYVELKSIDMLIQPSPLPLLSWGSSEEVWQSMLSREQKYQHSPGYLQRHPRIQPRMRAILLDWLQEVSEVYELHRQTLYLAQDYFDRFMLRQEDVEKDRLQLIGITALFIASKIEEIYPPKVADLAYVTDGACLEDQILHMELIMLKALDWNLCPETILSWLKLYIQMTSLTDDSDILVPQFSQDMYIQVTQLLDLCILDMGSLDFQYRVLAASALCHFLPYKLVEKASGLSWAELDRCIDWMAPYVETVASFDKVQPAHFPKVTFDDRHNIQTHTHYLTMLDMAQQRALENQILTPPSSTEKPGKS